MQGLGQVEVQIVNICRQRQAQGTVRTPNLTVLLMARGAMEALLDFQDQDTIWSHDQKAVYQYFMQDLDRLQERVTALAAGPRGASEVIQLLILLGKMRQEVEFTQPGTSSKINARVDATLKELTAINIQNAAAVQDKAIQEKVADMNREKEEALKKAGTTGLNEIIKGK